MSTSLFGYNKQRTLIYLQLFCGMGLTPANPFNRVERHFILNHLQHSLYEIDTNAPYKIYQNKIGTQVEDLHYAFLEVDESLPTNFSIKWTQCTSDCRIAAI